MTLVAVALENGAGSFGQGRLPGVGGQGDKQPQRGQPAGSRGHAQSPRAEASFLSDSIMIEAVEHAKTQFVTTCPPWADYAGNTVHTQDSTRASKSSRTPV